MNKTVNFLITIVLFAIAIVLISIGGAPHWRVGLALVFAVLAGWYGTKTRFGKLK